MTRSRASTTTPSCTLELEQGRERVAQRRLRLDRRRAGRGGTGIDRPVAGQVVLVDPAQRAALVVHEQRVLELLGPLQPAADLGPILAGMDDHRLELLEVADAQQREALQAPIGADEALDELGCRVGEDGCRGVVLGQDSAALEDRDAVGHLDRLVDVMGDEDDGLADLLLEAQELVLKADRDGSGRPRRTARP